ncbi:MAG: YIP1 family protein [Candidatus Aenigmatarchaeota archaeon]
MCLEEIKKMFNFEKFIRGKNIGVMEVFKVVASASLVPAIVFCFLSILLPLRVILPMRKFIQSPITIFITVEISLIIAFTAISVLIHIFTMLFKGKGKYEDTLNVCGAAALPLLLFGWITLLNIWASILSITILVWGISVKQKISIMKAAAAVSLPVILLTILMVGILIKIPAFYF